MGNARPLSEACVALATVRCQCWGTSHMDIGYFLKLMTEKNASDMFLTTGAPVYIKIEGKLYPLGNTGLPAGMVTLTNRSPSNPELPTANLLPSGILM